MHDGTTPISNIVLRALKSAETAAAVGQERGRGGAARLGVAQSAEQCRNVTMHESARAHTVKYTRVWQQRCLAATTPTTAQRGSSTCSGWL